MYWCIKMLWAFHLNILKKIIYTTRIYIIFYIRIIVLTRKIVCLSKFHYLNIHSSYTFHFTLILVSYLCTILIMSAKLICETFFSYESIYRLTIIMNKNYVLLNKIINFKWFWNVFHSVSGKNNQFNCIFYIYTQKLCYEKSLSILL